MSFHFGRSMFAAAGLASRVMTSKVALAIALAGIIAVILQAWIGPLTIYHGDLGEKREIMHDAILANEPPPGGWHAIGANGINIRVVAPGLAELAHRVTNISVSRIYRIVDTIALFSVLLLLLPFLRRWLPPEYCVIGVLYVGVCLVLTYFLHFFHPEDRLSLLAWISLLLLLRDGRMVLFTVGMLIGIAIKWDMVLAPALYWLNTVTRTSWRRPTAVTVLLFAISFGMVGLLRIVIFPGGFDKYDELGIVSQVIHQIVYNLGVMLDHHIAYPPLLVFALPAILAVRGLREAPRFVIASFAFGILLAVPFFILSNFIEVRAQMASLVMIAPAALLGLENLLAKGRPDPSAADR
jgi:hypothetical protein